MPTAESPGRLQSHQGDCRVTRPTAESPGRLQSHKIEIRVFFSLTRPRRAHVTKMDFPWYCLFPSSHITCRTAPPPLLSPEFLFRSSGSTFGLPPLLWFFSGLRARPIRGIDASCCFFFYFFSLISGFSGCAAQQSTFEPDKRTIQ